MRQTLREIAREAIPSKDEAKKYALVVGVVILAGVISAFLSYRWKFSRRLTYSTRECTALARLASIVVNGLRKRPDGKIKCPTSDGDSSALFRSLVPAPVATTAGSYEIMVEFQEFLKELFSTKCEDGYMTRGGLADAIEQGVVQRCSAYLL